MGNNYYIAKFIKFIHKNKEKRNYLLGGIWNTLFGYFAFALLYYILEKKISYYYIIIFSNILSITNAYIIYKIFVFKTKGNIFIEYLKFYLVYGIAAIINLILFSIFVKSLHINPYLSQAIILSIIIIGSYLAHKKFTFSKK